MQLAGISRILKGPYPVRHSCGLFLRVLVDVLLLDMSKCRSTDDPEPVLNSDEGSHGLTKDSPKHQGIPILNHECNSDPPLPHVARRHSSPHVVMNRMKTVAVCSVQSDHRRVSPAVCTAGARRMRTPDCVGPPSAGLQLAASGRPALHCAGLVGADQAAGALLVAWASVEPGGARA